MNETRRFVWSRVSEIPDASISEPATTSASWCSTGSPPIARLPWDYSEKWGAAWAKTDVIMVKPATFMNRSGQPLSAIANFYKIAAAEILVVLDDFALPLGRLRLRAQGSSGGHNGLESIFEHFGTEEIPRLRVGIGAAPSAGAVDYVLGRFFEEEQPAPRCDHQPRGGSREVRHRQRAVCCDECFQQTT